MERIPDHLMSYMRFVSNSGHHVFLESYKVAFELCALYSSLKGDNVFCLKTKSLHQMQVSSTLRCHSQ